ncbi:AraC family transcriptional regulator [Chryseobacterium paridis]|uniref:AraC family transcriptional regulator n=1 Tax=Chryseobacterium paridis TaxID=2800328 RepID=A0ABS1FYU1_9FLAO|nr:helix-turn-helix domain-containing protein [Chryseobacterium paridis]MBK1897616.1 AraC family transcriptional regulator [Chryseobacterium paridis]
MVVILQAIITLAVLLFLAQNRKSFHNMLLLYILTVVLDMGYEYFIIKRFGYESILYEIPGSLRIFKGLIFLSITLNFIEFKWRDKLKYLLFPFCFIVLFHTLALSAKLFGYKEADTLIHFYKTYLVNYYVYYWSASLVICIFLLYKYQYKIKNPFFKQFRLFLLFIFLGVIAFRFSYEFGIDILLFQKVYLLLFLIQFAWILYVYILTYQEQLKRDVPVPMIEVNIKEKYQYKDLSKIDFDKIQVSIEDFYKNSTLYLDENFTLENLSQNLSVSRTDLTITFNQYLTSNFHEYTNRNRVLQFRRMHQEEPDVNVTDLAFQCGFKSKSTFYKYFKKEFNCLPTEYAL